MIYCILLHILYYILFQVNPLLQKNVMICNFSIQFFHLNMKSLF